MNSFRALTAKLAFLADRKILSIPEASYYRMDISGHEHVGLATIKRRKPIPFAGIRRFVTTAIIIFLGLFTITNAAAYSKILYANIQDVMTPDPVYLSALGTDPWTGEHIAGAPEATLEALEAAVLVPEDGIIPLHFQPSSYDDRIHIPSLEINAKIVEPELGVEALVSSDWNKLEEQIKNSLKKGIVHYPGTAEPGEKGNVFLTGHSSNVFWEPSPYNTIFALLPRIEVGADIYVTYDQQEYLYRVTDKREVTPDNVSILKQGDSKSLTLMTCTPVGTRLKRLVVTAELIE